MAALYYTHTCPQLMEYITTDMLCATDARAAVADVGVISLDVVELS